MDVARQAPKARLFLALHDDPKMLVLPNIWDPLGAKMLERLGYPAVATASAAVAFSHGTDDGERIPFETMLGVIRSIADSVDVPITADVESGYARGPKDLAENMRRVLHAGAVGINLEDSDHRGSQLFPRELQRERIQAVREMADGEAVPLVINARTDTFLRGVGGSREERLAETLARGREYLAAGADCFYPILVGDLETLRLIRAESGARLNVYAGPGTAPMRELETAGVNRLSLGPGMLRASLTAMKRIAEDLSDYGSYEAFTTEVLSSEEIREIVRGTR